MNKELKKTYKLADKLFPKISKACQKCDTCCRTYGWLLEEEVKEFFEKGYPIIKINENLYCFDSFVRNKKQKRIFNKIPRCLFYKKGKCLIYKERPLDCRLYPIKVKIKKNSLIVGLSLGCKYISSLTEKKQECLSKEVINFFEKAPLSVVNNYLEMIKEVNLISKPKKFWMKEIAKLEKRKDSWEIIKLIRP